MVAVGLCTTSQAGDLDTATKSLSDGLRESLTKAGVKSAAVLDFTDVENATPQLGRLIAEEIAIHLVSAGSGFAVVDRANLEKLMAEHQLSSSGLVDPENARKLGKIAGVEAVVLGTITQLDNTFRVTAKIINTETAQIVGAARTTLEVTDSTRSLYQRLAGGGSRGGVTGGSEPSTPGLPEVRYDSQRLGPFKLTPARVQWIDDQRLHIDMEVVNETTNPAMLFAGRTSRHYSRQRLTASFETSGGKSLGLRELRGFKEGPAESPQELGYEKSQLALRLDGRQSSIITFEFSSRVKLMKAEVEGNLNAEFRAFPVGKQTQDVQKALVFKNLKAQ